MINKLTDNSQQAAADACAKTRTAIKLLLKASLYARDSGLARWDFALEIDRLYAAGLTINDIRWLVSRGFAACGQETTMHGDRSRKFRALRVLKFNNDTCFVLTDPGIAFASRLLHEHGSVPSPPNTQPHGNSHSESLALKPIWNPVRRELRLRGAIVKRFRVPARNQEQILRAFQEEGWPELIDDPLPFRKETDPRTRLHDTLYRLNHNQTCRLIRFHGNGAGDGVCWSLVDTKCKTRHRSC